MDPTYLLFLGICILNPCLQNIGMGIQKLSIDKTPLQKTSGGKTKWIGVWILGLLFQVAVVILGFKALSLGYPAATLGGFGGLGLVFLAVFAYVVLKEKILRNEYIGMALVVVGTAVLGIYSEGTQNMEVALEAHRMVTFFVPYFAMIAFGIFLLVRYKETYAGAVLGLIGGSMNGIGVVFQKIVTLTHLDVSGFDKLLLSLIQALSSPVTWIMIIGGVGGLIVIQYGYKYGKAVQVVPCHASMVVIVPAIAGVIIAKEHVPPIAWLCIVVIAIGVVIITTAAPAKHAA